MSWAELSDCQCYYELVGEGAPLVLIPGLGATCRMWDAITPDLSQHFSLVLFDNRGIGQSVARRSPTTLRELVSDVVELMDYLQVDRAHVLGVSLGGVMAQRLAVDHPSRIDRLVLVSCADTFSPYLRQISSFLARTLRYSRKETFVRTMELLGTAPEFLDANPDLVEQRVKTRSKANVSARAVENQLKCLAAEKLDLLNERIAAPTLVVAGQYDPIIPGCYAKQMADKIPGSQFHLVAGAGHNPLGDHPERVLPTLIEFLRAEELAETQAGRMEGYVPYFGGLSLPMEDCSGR